ncbi:MAG: acyltransferase [Oscillospiraceae bacterium]|nr:acyltransferase [Oscillospiraceae bacterium]MDD6085429.1 acyltransferase [Oscillospiraceae bacterium]MDY3257436.1 acyltransferase [Ruminococcus callidus]
MIKDILRKIVLGKRASSETYINYLRSKGACIGEGVRIFRPGNTVIDDQNPHLLKIGNDVQITGPVTILTHDYSWSVIKRKYGEILGNQKSVTIGNNVFIGWGATVLSGTTIGNNVIIGANSVVSGRIESDSVYAGNPARKIMSLDQFYEKRKMKQENEAINYINEYKKTYGKYPEKKDLNEYFFLFSNGNEDMCEKYIKQLNCMRNYETSLKYLKNNNPKYESFEQLIEEAKKRNQYETGNKK